MKTVTLFLHAAAVSLAATQAAIERTRTKRAIRHALALGIVDPRAMTFAQDEVDYARLHAAVASHLRGDESRVVLSCSVYNGFAPRLELELGIPVERSDDAGARAVVARARRIGLAVSYPPSYAVVEAHAHRIAREAGRLIELVPLMADNAFAFADDAPRYARVLSDAAASTLEVDAIFLAQYSMDPYAPVVAEATVVPVVSALDATLAALR
ncbi:MAG: hypothetical protein NVS2B8_16380 [Vulcanimicrobiaceae bacterium]